MSVATFPEFCAKLPDPRIHPSSSSITIGHATLLKVASELVVMSKVTLCLPPGHAMLSKIASEPVVWNFVCNVNSQTDDGDSIAK